ncbi:MAG: DNA cytosine methyltransferase [Bacillota bacterium]
MSNLTLGSLFDGSGGFPLGGILNGITPLWASEIEPFPIRVTTKRLPFMKHLGDISTIDGGKIEPVDIITFGSPCTDLSVAGKRAGLDGGHSSLFYEAIRIIKEMREATDGAKPRYIVWENVPGALSCSKGEDFRAVLEQILKVKDETHDVPVPEKGKWMSAGEIVDDDFSVCWRILDAQFWGVAQRRRRIYLVADFRGTSASKILFEFESMSGYSPKGIKPWQGVAADVTNCSGETVSFEPGAVSRIGGHYLENAACTLRAKMGDNQLAVAIENHPTDGRIKIDEEGRVQTLTSRMGTGGNNVPLVMNERQYAPTVSEGVANTLTATDYKGVQCVFEPICDHKPITLKIRSGCEGGGKGALMQEDKSATLSCNNEQTVFVPTAFDGKQVTSKINKSNPKPGTPCHTLAAGNADSAYVCYGICSDGSNSMKSDNPNSGIYEADTSRTLDANGGNPSCNQGGIAVVNKSVQLGFDGYNGNETGVVSSTLGANCGLSSGRQGVVSEVDTFALQGSMIGRDDDNGPNGDGVNEDVCFTLNTVDRHGVVYALDRETFNCGQNYARNLGISEDGIAATLNAQGPSAVAQPASFYPQMKAESQCFRDDGVANTIVNGTNPGFQNAVAFPEYSVRRLTPTECALLQGFPKDWGKNLETQNPSEEDIDWWQDVFDNHRKIFSSSNKAKSRKAIRAWLQNPHSDSAEYKMWGNGVALPCVCFVLAGIKWANEHS